MTHHQLRAQGRLAWGIAIAGTILVALVLLTSGCGTSVAKTIATSQNTYERQVARFDEACNAALRINPPRCSCDELVVRLNVYEKRLHAAAKALKDGGGLPLQLKDLKEAEKAVADCQ